MKSQRRHELQTNELADWLGEKLEALRPYATPIMLTAGLVLALILGWMWFAGSNESARARVWSSYFGAFNQREPTQALEKLASEGGGTPVALWAQQAVGDMSLAQGAAQLFSDRAEAQKLLEKAKEAYRRVEAAAEDPMLKARARLGLAKVYESLCQPEEARKYYELVAESQPQTAIGKAAAADAQRLKDKRQAELLAWFAEQKPKRPAPLPGLGGTVPGLPNDVPERPDISLPGGLGLGKLSEGLASEPSRAASEPAAGQPPTTPAEPEKAEGLKSEPPKTEAVKPDAAKPEGAKSDAAKPEGAKPEPAKPEFAPPHPPSGEAAKPEASKPEGE